MKKTSLALAALCVALAAPGFAVAQSRNASGAYMGLDYINTRISGLGSASGWGINGGYQFNENWALDLGYAAFGNYHWSGVDSLGAYDFTAGIHSTQISGVYTLPLGSSFGVFGRLGYSNVSLTDRGDISGGYTLRNGLLVGAGMSYDLTRNFALRGEVRRVASDAVSYSLGGAYKF